MSLSRNSSTAQVLKYGSVAAERQQHLDINTRTGWYSRRGVSEGTTAAGAAGGSGGGASAGGFGVDGREASGFPRIQGADGCGTIVAVGDGVAAGRVGERVLIEPVIRLNVRGSAQGHLLRLGVQWRFRGVCEHPVGECPCDRERIVGCRARVVPMRLRRGRAHARAQSDHRRRHRAGHRRLRRGGLRGRPARGAARRPRDRRGKPRRRRRPSRRSARSASSGAMPISQRVSGTRASMPSSTSSGESNSVSCSTSCDAGDGMPSRGPYRGRSSTLTCARCTSRTCGWRVARYSSRSCSEISSAISSAREIRPVVAKVFCARDSDASRHSGSSAPRSTRARSCCSPE